ncbi:MAG: hypothetical protein PHQ80_00820 [Candidatus ainarchaeum sp.]|nr:hypothetical protein [Candidatus ainarchaeum sp.]
MANLNLVSKAFGEGFGMARGNWKELFVQNVKIIVAGLVLTAVAGMLVGLLAALAGGAILGSAAGVWAGFALGIFVALMVYAGMASVAYNVVEEVEGKARHNLLGNFKKNVLPVAVYTIIVMVLIYGIGYGPRLALMLSGANISQNFTLTFALNIYETAVSVIIGLFIVFAMFELVLKGAGVLQCVGKSFSLVKANLIETIVFYLAYCIYSLVVGLVLGVVFAVLCGVPFMLGVMVSGIAGMGQATFVLALLALFGGAFLVAFLAGTYTAGLPIAYRFWKLVRKEK